LERYLIISPGPACYSDFAGRIFRDAGIAKTQRIAALSVGLLHRQRSQPQRRMRGLIGFLKADFAGVDRDGEKVNGAIKMLQPIPNGGKRRSRNADHVRFETISVALFVQG
jgi:hypothetical protein